VVTALHGVEVQCTVKQKLLFLAERNFCVFVGMFNMMPCDRPVSSDGLVTAWTASHLVLSHTPWRSSIFLWWFIRHVTGPWMVPTVYYDNIMMQVSKRWTDTSLEKVPVLWDVALYQWGKEFDVSEDCSVFIFRVTKTKV
jgi:hypothetical protein